MSRADVTTLKKEYGKRKRLTRAEAIRAFCIECMGYQIGLITNCPDEPCSLWPYRLGTEIPTDTPRRKK